LFALLRADLFKLRKRAMGWVMLVIVSLFVPLVMLEIAASQPKTANYSFPGSLLAGTGPLSVVGTFTVIVLGAILVGSEYGYDTWKNLLTRRHGRAPFILSKWLVMLIGLCIAVVILLLLGVIVGQILQSTMHLTGRPVQLSPLSTLILILMQLFMPIAAGSIAIMGAVIWRSSASGIVLGIVWYITDAVLTGLAPIASASTSITTLQGQITGLAVSSGSVAPVQLSASLAGPLGVVPTLVVIIYLIVPITIAAYLFGKRDMLGVS
jgi:ABC-2 type transport system permease protein